jgi:hypothetical protein
MNQNESRQVGTETVVLDAAQEASLAGSDSVYASLRNKFNLKNRRRGAPARCVPRQRYAVGGIGRRAGWPFAGVADAEIQELI